MKKRTRNRLDAERRRVAKLLQAADDGLEPRRGYSPEFSATNARYEFASRLRVPEHLQALRSVNKTSLMALPLVMHGQLAGILTFVSSTETHRYPQRDLRLAEALAERAAVAIENARLYHASATRRCRLRRSATRYSASSRTISAIR